tara:strand:- start:141 stop:770 length:630 start_codon:yes stop_codon:yes gene_type:complete
MRLNFNNILNFFNNLKEYFIPIKKFTNKFKSIDNIDQLEMFVKEQSAHVTQTTLYGYIKTRMGFKHYLMFENKSFLESIEIAKWNIYVVALADCTLYSLSYLVDKKNLKNYDAKKMFSRMMEQEKSNGLSEKIFSNAKIDFEQRLREINWNNYHQETPFKMSGLALYSWSPIAEELKVLDKEIVLNSIKLKWNLVQNEFKKLTVNFVPN